MKIDSMDASVLTSYRVQNNQPIIETPRQEPKETVEKPSNSDISSMMHLSEYARKELPISEKLVLEAIDRINRAISGSNRKFQYAVHEKTKEVMVKVIDSDTNQVIREFPPEKILDMVANMMEMAGIIVDERR